MMIKMMRSCVETFTEMINLMEVENLVSNMIEEIPKPCNSAAPKASEEATPDCGQKEEISRVNIERHYQLSAREVYILYNELILPKVKIGALTRDHKLALLRVIVKLIAKSKFKFRLNETVERGESLIEDGVMAPQHEDDEKNLELYLRQWLSMQDIAIESTKKNQKRNRTKQTSQDNCEQKVTSNVAKIDITGSDIFAQGVPANSFNNVVELVDAVNEKDMPLSDHMLNFGALGDCSDEEDALLRGPDKRQRSDDIKEGESI